jgi:formate dehydrogenase subunit gamma
MSESFANSLAVPAILPAGDDPRLLASPRTAREAAVLAFEKTEVSQPTQILRFHKSEIRTHWSIAIPFMLCYATGLILKLFFDLHSEGYGRDVLSWTHKLGGACLIILPAVSAVRHRREYRIHLDNIKKAWTWTITDLKWLILFAASNFSRKITLPEQHKFNAGEKLNFMMGMVTYPLFVATGLFLVLPGVHFLTWLGHLGLAVAMTPFMLGHIYLAVAHPSTRVGLGGMFSGHVDREWAKHHYRQWYREHFEKLERTDADREEARQMLRAPALVRCTFCQSEHEEPSLLHLLESVAEVQPVICPACGVNADSASVIVDAGNVDSTLRGLQEAGIDGLFVERSPIADLSSVSFTASGPLQTAQQPAHNR